MLYTITFLGSDRPTDTIWLNRPGVDDLIKTNLLSGEELEYWTIVDLDDYEQTVKVRKL